MAHNINYNSKTGRYSFVSKVELPWHNLGTVVKALTSEEAIVLGGLDFEVEKRPVLVHGAKLELGQDTREKSLVARHNKLNVDLSTTTTYRELKEIPKRFCTVRTDNHHPLGIVGSDYTVVQNREAFDFIDSIVGEGYADYETAGCLGNGETVFVTVKLKESMVVNNDNINNYLLLTMAHDGSASITVMFTSIRVVCNNTLSLALKGNNKVTIRHTKNVKARLEHAKKVLGLIDKQLAAHQEAFNFLANKEVTLQEAQYIVATSLGVETDEKGRYSARGNNIVNKAMTYYNRGFGQEGIVGSAWGVFNGVTGYLQNVKNYTDEESKFKNTFATAGAKARQTAFELLTFDM